MIYKQNNKMLKAALIHIFILTMGQWVIVSIFSSRSTNIFLWKSLDKPAVYYLLSTKHQTD